MLRLKSFQAALFYSLLNLLMNIPAFKLVYAYSQGAEESHLLFFASVVFGVFMLSLLIFEALLFPKIYKWLLTVVFLFNGCLLFFMIRYNVIFDKDMLVNMLHSDLRESSEYLGFHTYAVLSLILIALFLNWRRVQVSFDRLQKEFRQKGIVVFVLIVLFSLNLLFFFKDYSFFFRQNKQFKHLLLPLNYIDASFGAVRRYREANRPMVDLRSETRLESAKWNQITQKTVFVMIIGETARAQNFSLLGYSRKTNPELEKVKDLVSFSQVQSCGTSTAVSVPCLFDYRGREEFMSSHERYSNLLDLLDRAGFEVTWLDNNTGCQGVCANVRQVDLLTLSLPKDVCDSGHCFDDALFLGLQHVIEQSSSNKIFVVLHMLGSHGPQYFKRYPPPFDKFQPNCHGEDLASCTREQVVNSYDNTILYTDSVLAKTIFYLQGKKDWNVSWLYVSDHGESLGEKGLYLHAMPFRFAPDEQTHVPLLTWFNADFLKQFRIDLNCVEKQKDKALSHDFIFHTYLGLTQVQHPVYDPQKDLFKDCRQ